MLFEARLFAAKLENTSKLKPAKKSIAVANLVPVILFDFIVVGNWLGLAREMRG